MTRQVTRQLLPADDMARLIALRRKLHMAPDLSGQETATAAQLLEFLHLTKPARVVPGLGGTGLALVYDSGRAGPRVMFRAELDALPIVEQTALDHASRVTGAAHLCGHDGHMAILAGLGLWIARNPPGSGQVVLLFQPAEETGAGARAVLADPQFDALRPDWAFALHNMPGLGLGHVAVAPGPASCASVGLRVRLTGREAHAAQPETGRSPAPVLAAIMDLLAPYMTPGPMGPHFGLATLCHMSLGQPAFGIAPASAEAWITLRGYDDAVLADLEARLCAGIAAAATGVRCDITRHDAFHASVNDPAAAEIVQAVQARLDLPTARFTFPMRPSEDFGAFSQVTRMALVFLGAGEAQPALHDPAYDFPDPLIAPGIALFAGITEQLLGV